VSLGIYGSSTLTLDIKGRIAIPARYRDLLRQNCEGSIVITKDPQYPALMIYPGKLWKDISAKFEALGGLNQKVRSIQWKILGNASVTDFVNSPNIERFCRIKSERTGCSSRYGF
jgi:MraZ protein